MRRALFRATALLLFSCRAHAPPAAEPDPGKRLYSVHCSTCHGETGDGTPAGPRVGGFGYRMGLTMSFGMMRRGVLRRLRNGGQNMPAFRDQLTPLELEQVTEYLERL